METSIQRERMALRKIDGRNLATLLYTDGKNKYQLEEESWRVAVGVTSKHTDYQTVRSYNPLPAPETIDGDGWVNNGTLYVNRGGEDGVTYRLLRLTNPLKKSSIFGRLKKALGG